MCVCVYIKESEIPLYQSVLAPIKLSKNISKKLNLVNHSISPVSLNIPHISTDKILSKKVESCQIQGYTLGVCNNTRNDIEEFIS